MKIEKDSLVNMGWSGYDAVCQREKKDMLENN